MGTYSFTVTCNDYTMFDQDEITDKLFEVGCDDCLITFRGIKCALIFDRVASSMWEAVQSGIDDAKDAGLNPTSINLNLRDNYK